MTEAQRAAMKAKMAARVAARSANISPDLKDYQAYHGLLREAEWFAQLRSSVGEGTGAENICTPQEADAERDGYTQRIAELADQAAAHVDGARRWAREGRETLPEFPWH